MPRFLIPRFLVALATSAALATGAAPARAQGIDRGGVIVGAVTLGLLAAILSDLKNNAQRHAIPAPPAKSHAKPHTKPHNKTKSKKKAGVYKVSPARLPVQPHSGQGHKRYSAQNQNWHLGGRGGVHGRGPILPAHCLRDLSRDGQSRRLYGRQCLSQARVPVGTLPAACLVRLPSRNGTYAGYVPGCLRDRGYRMSRR